MWIIFFALPNLSLSESIGNENIAIVPHDDIRIIENTKRSSYTKALVENFEDQFGRKNHPSLLIINESAPQHLREIEAIVGFRNIFALSTIIKGHEHSLTRTFVAHPLYSDYFDFYPITICKDDDGFLTHSSSVLGFDDETRKFRGQTSPSLAGAGSFSAAAKDELFNLLEKVWERRFIRRRVKEWSTTALFRSLEMAYQATTMPFKNHSTIYDYGASASLWVSAFEILSHPRRGRADLLSVLDLIGKCQWNDTVIKRRAYRVRYRGQLRGVNLVQRLYKELYDTRNDFLHGNPVRLTRLHPFRNTSAHPITRFAPLIYKTAVLAYLERFKDRRKKADWQKQYIAKLMQKRKLSEALLKAKVP